MSEFYTKKLNCGRNSLRFIIRTYNIKEIFIPYYTCPSVWQAIKREKCKINFYHIDKNFLPTIEFPKNSYILYTNYFGINGRNVITLTNKYKNLIIDNAHAFFMPQIGLAGFNSIRKFLPTPDGSIVYTTKENKTIYSPDESYKNLTNTDFRNRNFDISEDIKAISNKTVKLLNNIDITLNKAYRIEKFYELDRKYHSTNLLKFSLYEYDVPYVYPYLSENNIDIPYETFWTPQPITSTEGYFQRYLKGILL